ncbi:MAG: YfhO family protein [bacterium]
MPKRCAPAESLDARTTLLLAFGIAAATILAILGPGLVLGRTPLLRDLVLFFHPWTDHAARRVAAGEYPLWNPLVYCGTSWASQVQGRVLYPTFPLYLVFPYGFAAQLDLALHLAGGAVCAAWFLLRMGAGRAGSIFGGVAAILNGWMLAKLEAPEKVAILALVPLALLGFALARDGRARAGAALAAVAIALQLLNGYPPLSLYAIGAEVFAGIALVVFAAEGHERSARAGRGALVAAGALAIGVLLACASLVPFAADVRESAYAKPLPAEMAAARSLLPVHTAGVFMPRWTGLPGNDRYWGGELSVYTAGAIYVGLPAVLLALVAIAWAIRPARRGDGARADTLTAQRSAILALAIVAAVATLVAFGRHSFLFGFLRGAFPFYATTRWPSQSLCVVPLAIGLLGGFGLGVIERRLAGGESATVRRRAAGAGIVVAGCLLAMSLIPAAQRPVLALLEGAMLPHQSAAFAAHAAAFLRGDLQRAALVVAAAALALALPLRAWLLVAAFTATDLALLGRTLAPYTRENLFEDRAGTGALEGVRDRGERILRMGGDLALEMSVYGARGALILREAERSLSGATPLLHGLPAADGADPLQSARNAYLVGALTREKTPAQMREKIGAVLGVGAFVIPNRASVADLAALSSIPDTITFRASALEPVPFAYLVGRVEAIPRDDDQIIRLVSDDFDPRRAALVATLPAGFALERDAGAGEGAYAACRVERPRAERIRIAVAPQSDALLVVRESHHSGWRATVDGRERAIERTNFLVMGIPVHAGESSVELVFAPKSVRVGFALSALGVAALALLFAWPRMRRRAS